MIKLKDWALFVFGAMFIGFATNDFNHGYYGSGTFEIITGLGMLIVSLTRAMKRFIG